LKTVETPKAPKPIGPYSQAIAARGMVYVSGMIALDPASGQMVKGGITEQTERTLENLKAVLKEAGSSMKKVVKVTVYVKETSYFKAMNEVYAGFFSQHKPARATVVCGFVRDDILVEIDAIAVA
jgi:2-iminobutanoate/2-iminopropanoate deaminase